MRIHALRHLRGPHLHAARSGVLARVDWQASDDAWPGEQGERLRHRLALLREAVPMAVESQWLATPAPLLRRPFAAAHLVLALAELLLRDFTVQPALGQVFSGPGGPLALFVPCDQLELGQVALRFAAAAQSGLAAGTSDAQVIEALRQGWQQARQQLRVHGLNQSTLALARAAAARDIPWTRLAFGTQYVQLGQGARQHRIMETGTDRTSVVAHTLTGDKYATAQLLAHHGLPTAATQLVRDAQQACEVAKALGWPVVVKPRSLGKGKGVTVEVRDEAGVRAAFAAAAAWQAQVLVERCITGADHRLLVVGGKLVAAALRLPAAVTGDGVHSVRALVAAANRDPQRAGRFERLREQIALDSEARDQLAAQGLDVDSVPAAGRLVRLRGAANLSRGGSSVDVTDEVHPDNRAMVERAARLTGVDVAGIDFFTPDIRQPWHAVPCAILEVNTLPGLRSHLGANPGRDVAGAIVDHLFAGAGGRVPTVGITGSVGKTTTCRMVAAILAQAGHCVGLSTTQGAWIGGQVIQAGDVAGGGMAQRLLSDPAVEAGVFELSRGGLVKAGMALDALDVGVLLNVHDNHLGLDGVHTRESLAHLKGLVPRQARALAVLNADDPLCLAQRAGLQARALCLVTTDPQQPEVAAHREAGGLVASWQGTGATAVIRLQQGDTVLGELRGDAIPASHGGRYPAVLADAAHALAAAHGLGIPFAVGARALAAFTSDAENNPGRMNFVPGLPFQLLLTITDGVAPNQALADFVRSGDFPAERRLVLQGAGNRGDDYLRAAGRATAGAFTRYYCADMEEDLRGRPPGEVAQLLAQGLREAGVAADAIVVEPSSTTAMERAFAEMPAGGLLVVVEYYREKVLQAARAWSSPRA